MLLNLIGIEFKIIFTIEISLVITADNDAVSIHIHCMQYRNALEIHCKHTASQLHVAERDV